MQAAGFKIGPDPSGMRKAVTGQALTHKPHFTQRAVNAGRIHTYGAKSRTSQIGIQFSRLVVTGTRNGDRWSGNGTFPTISIWLQSAVPTPAR